MVTKDIKISIKLTWGLFHEKREEEGNSDSTIGIVPVFRKAPKFA